MQIGLSQIVMGNMSLSELFAQAKAAGYEALELVLKNEGELTPKTTAADLNHIAKRAADDGLSLIALVHGHVTGNLLGVGAARELAVEQTADGLRVAKALGIDCTLHTLGRLSPDVYYDEAYASGVRSLRELAPTAEKLGVAVAVEFVWNGFAFSPLEMRRFLDEVNSPQVGFYFDPGNMAVFQFPQHWARITGPHIKMVHLKDWTGNALNGSWPPLLQGKVDFAAINRELRAVGYDGPMISEVPTGTASLKATADAIRRIIAM